MAKAPERQGIREEFTSRAFDVSSVRAAFMKTARFIEEQQDHGKSIQGLMNAFEGLDLANLLGGRIAVTGAAKTIKESAAAQKRADKDAEDWAFYLTLIQDGQVGYYIANEIFDNKTDWEIFEIVAEIEAATGNSFENYAKSILGEDNVPERLEDESDADYQRRVLKTIAVEILDPHTGQIKPQYANDPVAKIVAREEPYQRTVAKTAEIEGRYKRGEITLEQATNEVREDAQKSFSIGDVYGSEAENGEIIKTAKEIQNTMRDTESRNHKKVSANRSFFDSMPDSSIISKASEAGKKEFNTKSQDEISRTAGNELSIEFDSKPS